MADLMKVLLAQAEDLDLKGGKLVLGGWFAVDDKGQIYGNHCGGKVAGADGARAARLLADCLDKPESAKETKGEK